MKVIFLDIDGVLNSRQYDRERDPATQGNMDETRLPLLRKMVTATGAVIVLSSSWRKHWDPDPALRDEVGEELAGTLGRFGLPIFSKTPLIDAADRAREVRAWLAAHEGEVERYVILDDSPFGWGELTDFMIRTDPNRGRGLMEPHVETAIRLLNGTDDL